MKESGIQLAADREASHGIPPERRCVIAAVERQRREIVGGVNEL